MKNLFQTLTIIIIFFAIDTFGQRPINIIDSTVSFHKKEIGKYMCGLAEGDQLIFSFDELNKKDIDEIDITEYNSNNVLYKEFFKSKVENKTINITKTAIYKFEFYNKNYTAPYVCRFKIQRIPASKATKKFNTKVYGERKSDTAFIFNTEKYLISSDTNIITLFNGKAIAVEPKSSNKNKSYITFKIPAKTISLSYYIGVGKNAEIVINKANQETKKNKDHFKLYSNDTIGSILNALMAEKGTSDYKYAEKADTVKYWFVRFNRNLHDFLDGKEFSSIDKGKASLIAKNINLTLSDSVHICFENDNLKNIDVNVRVYAITVNENWGERKVPNHIVRTWYEPYLKN